MICKEYKDIYNETNPQLDKSMFNLDFIVKNLDSANDFYYSYVENENNIYSNNEYVDGYIKRSEKNENITYLEHILKHTDASLKSKSEYIELELYSKRLTSVLLQKAQVLEKTNVNLSIDLIYKVMNSLLKDNNITLCEKILENISVKHLSVDIMLSFLTITLAASNKLRDYRKKLYSNIRNELISRAMDVENLLYGLE